MSSFSKKLPPPSYARQTQSSQAKGTGHIAGHGTINPGRRVVSSAAVVVAPTQSPKGKFPPRSHFPTLPPPPFRPPKEVRTCVCVSQRCNAQALTISGRRAAFVALHRSPTLDLGPWRLSLSLSPHPPCALRHDRAAPSLPKSPESRTS